MGEYTLTKTLQNREKLIKELDAIWQLETPMGLTINFDGNGGYKLDAKLGDKAVKEIITNKKD